jgi:site-specific recombinase XerD
MDRTRIQDAKGRADRAGKGKAGKRTKRPAGIEVIERDGRWHLSGTINVGGRSQLVRKSTRLAARPDTRAEALEIKRQYEAKYVAEVVYGIKSSIALGVAAYRYLEVKTLPANDLRILQLAVHDFALRDLDTIGGEEWSGWALRHNRGNAPATIVRFMAPIKSFLRWSSKGGRKWLCEMPEIELPRARREKHRKRRRVPELTSELLVFLFDHAPLHLKAQVYTEWSTGARVKSILFGCRLCDLILSPQRSQITFHDTKNGDAVTAHLHAATAEVLAEYLEHRGQLDKREGPLFLTDRHRPYSDKGRQKGWGSENKTAWRGMVGRAVKARRRTAAEARAACDRVAAALLWAEAALLAQVTPHWLRHWFATHALSDGMSLEAIAAQGGWRDYRSIQAYAHDVPEVRRRAIDNLPIGRGAIGTLLARKTKSHD